VERFSEETSQSFRLIELPLSLTHRMERHGYDAIPSFGAQVIDGNRNPGLPEEGLQPIGPVVFVEVNGIPG